MLLLILWPLKLQSACLCATKCEPSGIQVWICTYHLLCSLNSCVDYDLTNVYQRARFCVSVHLVVHREFDILVLYMSC